MFTAQHSTAQHSTAQHSTAQHSTAQQLAKHVKRVALLLAALIWFTISQQAQAKCSLNFYELMGKGSTAKCEKNKPCQIPATSYFVANPSTVFSGGPNIDNICTTPREAMAYVGSGVFCQTLAQQPGMEAYLFTGGWDVSVSADTTNGGEIAYAHCLSNIPNFRHGAGALHKFWGCPKYFVITTNSTDPNIKQMCAHTPTCEAGFLTPLIDLQNLHDNAAEKAVNCTVNLENNTRACDSLLTPDFVTDMNCLMREFGAAGVSASVTSTYRSSGYQAHFGEVFNYTLLYKKLNKEKQEQCDIANGWHAGKDHKLVYPPARNIGTHGHRGNAFDISSDGIKNFKKTQSSADLVGAATRCNLSWGGAWPPPRQPDEVHFSR